MVTHLAGLIFAAVIVATTAAAQSPDRLAAANAMAANGGTRMEDSCDYDRCALRLTLNFGTWHVVRGVDGVQVATLGMVRAPNLEPLVATSPAAAKEAREFRTRYAQSAALLWGGAGVALVGIVASIGNNAHPAGLAVGFAGVATMLVGAWQHGKSVDLLSRSIWVYNRTLSR